MEAEEIVVERTECDAASLTTLSEDGYIVIDDQAPQVLNAQVQKGAFYGIYCAAKSLVVSPPTVSHNDKSYDTSKWEDADEHNQEYIDARHAAEEVRSGISSKFSGISGYTCTYKVCKFRIVESKDRNGNPVRDYFLKILIGSPRLKYVFAQVHETGKKLSLVNDYLKSSPQ